MQFMFYCSFLTWNQRQNKHTAKERVVRKMFKVYKEKLIKREVMNLKMRKNESTVCKVLNQLFNALNF